MVYLKVPDDLGERYVPDDLGTQFAEEMRDEDRDARRNGNDVPLDRDDAAGRGLANLLPRDLARQMRRAGLDRETSESLVDQLARDTAKIAIQLGANPDVLADAQPRQTTRSITFRPIGDLIATP